MEILEYGVKLADYMSPAAKSAKTSLDGLTKSLNTAKSDLSKYQAQLQRANQLGDIEGHKRYTALVEQSRKSVYGLTQQLEATPKAADTAGASFKALATEIGAVAGPIAAVAAAGAALVGGLAAVTFEMAKTAIEATEAKDQLTTMFDALGDGPGAGQATLDMLDGLESELGQTRERLSEWAQEYEAIGITDLSGVRYQLQATGAAYAIMGEKGASAYEHLEAKLQETIETGAKFKLADKAIAGLAKTGANVSDIAVKMGLTTKELRDELKKGSVDAQAFGDALSEAIIEKGQGPLDNLRNDIGTITAQAHESFFRLFDGVGPAAEGFKLQLADVAGLLKEGVPSADALKAGITGFLDEVFEIGSEAVPIAKHAFLEFEIGALRTYIAFKPAVRAFKDLDSALGPLAPSMHGVDSELRLYVDLMTVAVQTTAQFVDIAAKALQFNVQMQSFGQLGGHAAGGLAAGIQGGKDKARGAGEDLAGAAQQGVVKKLEIQSPSRVGIRIGEMFGLGIAGGTRQSTRTVERASVNMGERMAEAPRLGFAPVAPPPAQNAPQAPSPYDMPYGSQGGRSVTINVGGLHFEGAPGPQTMGVTETAVAALFERLADQAGL